MNNSSIYQNLDAVPDYAPEASIESKAREKQADLIVRLASEVELFHDADHTPFARIQVDGHHEVHPIGTTFERWLRKLFFEKHGGRSPSSNSMVDALETIKAQALFSGDKREVYKRIAGRGDSIFVDLCNDAWEVVEITPDGWEVLKDSPVMFIRPAGMAPLPTPTVNGDIGKLREFINCEDSDFKFIIAWILAAYCPTGPYPILEIGGEQGSAKSSLTRILKAITDPNKAPLNTMPTTDKDVALMTKSERVLAFDNVSSLSMGLSDTFCRLVTGGAFKCRQLYTDSGQVVLDLSAPMVWNGIVDIATNGDLLERTLKVFLPAIEPDRKTDEKDFWSRFNAAIPGILGGMFDVLSSILLHRPNTTLAEKPRLADFSLWITAGEQALGWESGAFNRLYLETLKAHKQEAADDDEFTMAMIQIVKRDQKIKLQARDLIELIKKEVPDSKTLPTCRTLKGRLRRIAPALRVEGITWEYERSNCARFYSLSFLV